MRLFIRIMLIAAVAAGLTGCSKQAAQSHKPRIALVMKSLSNEFFKMMADGATAHQKAHASEYDLIANGIKDEQDVNKQVELVEQMIAES